MHASVRSVVGRVVGPPPPGVVVLWGASGRRAVSAGLSVAVPLAIGVSFGQPGLGSAAALGGLTALYGHQLPYRRRAAVVAGCGTALVAAVALGGLAAASPVVLSVVLGVLAGAASAAGALLRIGPPGPLGVVLVGGSASALGASAGTLAEHVAAAGAGAGFAWVVVMLAWVWDPAGPERRALDAARAAVASTGALRPAVVARSIRVADAAVRAGSRRRPSLQDAVVALEEQFLRELPVGPVPAPTGGGPLRVEPAGRRAPAFVWTALRTAAGVTAAGLVAAALGLTSAYWASTAAVAVLLGADARTTRDRAVHRAVGTVVGVGIAALLIAARLPVGVEVAVVGLVLVGVELLVAHQYVLAVSLITPLSLMLVHIGAPDRSGAELVGTRLAETLVGIALAVAAGLALFPRAAGKQLPAVVTAADESTAALAAGTADDDELRSALDRLNEVATAAHAEFWSPPATDRWLHRGRWVSDIGWGLLAARARGDTGLTEAISRRAEQ